MKIIIFGKTGQVGQEMINLLLNSRIPHLATGRDDVDHNDFDNLDFSIRPRWPLDLNAAFLKGAGVKL